MKHQPLLFAPKSKARAVRSYVLRSGRITPAQKRALDLHWTTYGLDPYEGTQGFHKIANLKPWRARVLEIGFGDGMSLLTQAAGAPDYCFIGIEVYAAGLGRLLHQLAAQKIDNVFVYYADALSVLPLCIPDASLDRMQIDFPDPWPKKKHTKRRLVQTDTLPVFLRKLKTGGILSLATDCKDYAEQMAEAIESATAEFNVSVGRSDKTFTFRPPTKFERAGKAIRSRIDYFLIQKKLDVKVCNQLVQKSQTEPAGT